MVNVLSARELVAFTAEVIYVVSRYSVSMDKAFQRVKRRWGVGSKTAYDVVADVLRNYYLLDHMAAKIFGTASNKALVKAWLLWKGREFFRKRNDVDAYIKKLRKSARETPDDVLSGLRDMDMHTYLALAHSYPRWVVEGLAKFMDGGEVGALLSGLNREHIWIRVNTLLADVDKTVKALEGQGVYVEQDRDVWFLLRVVGSKRPVHRAEIFRTGRAIIQDKASVLTVLSLAPSRDEHVLDACAAPGMKTSLIMQLTENRARVTAVDVSKRRARNMVRLLRRLGVDLERVDIIVSDSRLLDIKAFDRALLDAPCSSSGAVGRDPAIKVALRRREKVRWYVEVQNDLLRRLAELGKPVLYTTCSVLPEEGEEVVAQYTTRKPLAVLAEAYGGIRAGRTLPHVHLSEGFFMALVEPQR